MKKNFYLDVVIFIACLICLITGLMLDFHLIAGGREVRHYWREIHTYVGYAMAAGVLLHIIWHVKWIKAAAKQIFCKK